MTLRKQVIEDIYQIMGISDIMRGATDPQRDPWRPTAENAKWLYAYTGQATGAGPAGAGSGRDHVSRLLPDFDPVTIIEMSQTQLPTQDMQRSSAADRPADAAAARPDAADAAGTTAS